MRHWKWSRLAQALSILLGVLLVLTAGGWLVAFLPADDRFIYPLYWLAYTISRWAVAPSALILGFTMITIWPLFIEWGISRGAATGVNAPNMRAWLILLAVAALSYGTFRTFHAPQVLDTARTDDNRYIFSAREHDLRQTEFFLYECDGRGIVCASILPAETVSAAWHTRLRLDADSDGVRVMNAQTAIFTHPPP